MAKDKKLSIIFHSIAGITLTSLLIVCAFFDLQISKALSNGNSFFGELFAVIGEWPAYFVFPICGTLLFYCDFSLLKKEQKFIIKIVSLLIIFLGLFAYMMLKDHEFKSHKVLFSVFYSTLIGCACLFVGKFIPKEKCTMLVNYCIFALTVVLVSVIVIKILKLTWARTRFRDMLVANDFSTFTPWYVIGGEGGSSMPSGHTASASNIFVLMPLCLYFEKLNKYRYLLQIFCVIFVVLTAFSRVVYNAHFLSDTIFGGVISYLVYFIFKKIFFKQLSVSLEGRVLC